MSLKRASGALSHILLKFKSDSELPATGNFFAMPFLSGVTLGGQQDIEDDPVLGQGRDPLDPMLGVENAGGDVPVPIDARYFGLWLKGLYGAPVSSPSKAEGQIVFSANPAAAQTITINGVTFSFIAGASAGTNIGIKATVALTIDEIVAVLNASSNPSVSAATYSHPAGVPVLQIVHDTNGAAGNAFTFSASHAKASDKTLIGGGFAHVFKTGADDLPFCDIEKGFTNINRYRVYDTCYFNTLALDFQRSGAARAVIGIIARQQKAAAPASGGGTPQKLAFDRTSQFKGYIKSGGVYVGNLMSASFQHSNNMAPVQTIRDDSRNDGVDIGVTANTGTIVARLSNDNGLIDAAESEAKIDLELGYKTTPGLIVKWGLHRVTLAKPSEPISGPGGVEVTLNYQGSKDPTTGCVSTVTLINDLDGTIYA